MMRTLWRSNTGRAAVIAAVITGCALPATGGLVAVIWPAGCEIRGDPGIYRWTCLLPGIGITLGPVLAAALLALNVANRARLRPLAPGWFLSLAGFGLLTQITTGIFYGLSLRPAYRTDFFFEFMTIPQPFVAGAIAAGVYRLALARVAR